MSTAVGTTEVENEPRRAVGERRPVSTAGLAAGTRTALRVLLVLVVVGSDVMMLNAIIGQHGGQVMYDFKGGLYNAGVAILHGRSFYEPGFLSRQAAIMHAGGIGRGELGTNPFSIPVYPAFANVLVVPLALLPLLPAAVIYAALSVAAMVAAIWLLGVRDWRCMVVALASWPFTFGAFLGAVGPFLVLGAAIAWRWRDRLWPPALAIAAIVAAKIFPWPLGIWLLITRRFKAAALCAAACLVITFAAWALIGFSGMAQYPKMLSDMSFLQEGRAVSLVTALLVVGVSSGVATVCSVVAGLAILGLAWRFSRRPDGDRQAFGLAIIAALTATPIVWEHYMVLLFVPIALISPRMSALWLLPLLTPIGDLLMNTFVHAGAKLDPHPVTALYQAGLWLIVEVIVAVALCTTAPQRREWRARLLGRAPRVSTVSSPEGAHA